jgi:hypothetical protein
MYPTPTISPHTARTADLIGREFGRLVVVCRAGSAGSHATWFCRCDCLGSVIVKSCYLLYGRVLSCGCLQRERAKRHGHSIMATHPRWRGRLLALPRYEDDPEAVADHSPCRVPWESYSIVFKPDAKLLKRKPGRPRLPAAEVARRAAAKLPNGRPQYTGTQGERTRNECDRLISDAAMRWERAAELLAGA